MNIAKNIFKTSFIYFIGQVLTKLMAFILLPLYTNYVNVSDYGFYDLSISVLGVIIPVVFMEIWTATLRFSIEKKDNDGKKYVINNTIIISLFTFVIYFIGYIIAFAILRFEMPVWIFLYSFFWVLQLLFLNIARAYGRNSLYAFSGVVSVFVNSVVTIATVLIMDGRIETLYIGITISFIVQVLIIEKKIHVIRNFSFKDFDRDLCEELIKFSFPLSFNSVIHWMLEGFNKLLIVAKLGEHANGIYAIGSRLSTVLNLVISVFLLSWQETIFKITDKNDKNNIYNTGINTFIKTVGCALVALVPIIHILFPFVIGQDYSEAFNLMPLLLLSIFMNAVCGVITPLFAAEKATKYSMYSKVFMCIGNAVVIFLLIDKCGLYASPIALIIANIIGIISQIYMSKRFTTIRLEINNIIVFCLLFSISTYTYYNSSTIGNISWFIISLIIYSVYLREFIVQVIHLLTGVLKKREES